MGPGVVTATVTAVGVEREVVVRPAAAGDWWWLTRAGLAPELVGRQYHWAETPLQVLIAPTRGTPLRAGPRAVIEVDGRRAGYIGRNPLSGNLEYFLAPWARGGVGARAIAAFLRHGRPGDRSRAFVVSHHNARSAAALRRALDAAGARYEVVPGRWGDRYVLPRSETTTE